MQRLRKLLHVEGHVVDDVDLGGRVVLKCLRPMGSSQEVEGEKECGNTLRLLDVEQCTLDEPLVETVAVRRVRDDIPGDGSGIPEKIDAGEPGTVFAKVTRNDGVAGLAELGNDGSLTARGFPDVALELDVGDERSRCRRMGRVVVEPGTSVPVRTDRTFP